MVIGFVVLVATMNGGSVTIGPFTQSAPVFEIGTTTTTTSGGFNETGTLVFYPNNVGPVPYLFYQDYAGHTVAKALTFSDALPASFSSWAGARVAVTGVLDSEHVVVSRIAYLAAP